jgi:hypothetical protein
MGEGLSSGERSAPVLGLEDAVDANRARSGSRARESTPHLLDAADLTVLTAWAAAVAEMLAYAPERVEALVAEARTGAPWRASLGLTQPSPRLAEAIDAMGRTIQAATSADGRSGFDALLTAATEDRTEEGGLGCVVRRVLLSMLEQRCTRQPVSDGRR